jgi:hypothetical protein
MAEKLKSAFERFRDLTKRVVSVPKPVIDRREAEYRRRKKGTEHNHSETESK